MKEETHNSLQIPVTRGVRGATTVEYNDKEVILKATRELLYLLIKTNDITQEDLCSVIFTTTKDLDATFPAIAARQFGWTDVGMLCHHELPVPGSLPMCIRILINWNTTKPLNRINHIYLREARKLRPDRYVPYEMTPEEVEAAIETYMASKNE